MSGDKWVVGKNKRCKFVTMIEYIEIPVLFHTKESKALNDLYLDVELCDLNEVVIPFFRLDIIIPFSYKGTDYSQILIGENVYYSRLSIEEILCMIDEKNAEIFIPFDN
jgi:hypothetical protein